MKVTSLRLGNIVGFIYDPDRYGIVIALEMSGSVHLSNKDTPDDIRDISGIRPTERMLAELGCKTSIFVNGIEVNISFPETKAAISIDGVSYPITFLHQLQNIFYAVTGQDLLEPDELLQLAYR